MTCARTIIIRARNHTRHRDRGEAGETLIETLMTVVIMGIAFVAVLFAIGSAIRLSGTHREQADTGIALNAAAEAVKAADPAGCPVDESTFEPALDGLELPPGVTVSITDANCGDLDLQTITITAASDGSVRGIDIVKRSA